MNAKELISNDVFSCIASFIEHTSSEDYCEHLAFSYAFNPVTDHVMTTSSNLFDLKKAAAIYFWYKFGKKEDTFITKYFDEYAHCIDETHEQFNSNYGYYAYTECLLKRCIDYLVEDQQTRQACFCINNNDAMSESSIDKLCTNAIHFFIRNNRLEMVIQMRSSNILTLLPYDVFMFTVFYQHVYFALRFLNNIQINTGMINVQVASLHLYKSDLCKYKLLDKANPERLIEDFSDKEWQNKLERKLLKALQKDESSKM